MVFLKFPMRDNTRGFIPGRSTQSLGNDEEDKTNIKNKILHNVWIQSRDERVHMADVIHF